MTGSPSRLVAVQAVVVGVLLVIVFITLLAPDTESPLSGIEGPGGSGQTQLPGPDIYTGPTEPGDDDGRGEGDGNGGDGRPGGPGSGGGGGPGAAGPPDLGLTGPPVTAGGGTAESGGVGGDDADRDGGDADDPSDDQYADSLSRLVARID
jgi:hypothetical protein